jgi:N-acetylglucosamine-6-phosphate deacetylase
MKYITSEYIITPSTVLKDHAIGIENGIIQAVVPKNKIRGKGITDFGSAFITPGLIDIHIHGCNGADVMDATFESLNHMSVFLASHGVTGFVATTISADKQSIMHAIKVAIAFQSKLEGARLLGIHLEGPYLNNQYKGAHSSDFLRLPDPNEYQEWFKHDIIQLVTIAPEIKGADEIINYGRERGMLFAIGHSNASYKEVLASADAGLTQATHIFNGMGRLHHREPGTVGAILTDNRIFAQMIADGIHLHPAVVKLVIAAKGIDKTVLISDSIRATGLGDGTYLLGEMEVTVKNGKPRIESGGLAGSTLTLDQAVRNVIKFSSISFGDAVAMASFVPSRAMNWQNSRGSIIAGADADLAVFNQDLQVVSTFVKGKLVYQI